MKKLEQEIFSDKSKIFKWPPFFYIHRYTPNFFIKRLQIVYIFFFYMSPDWEGLRRGWIHPFFNKNVIFDKNLWFFKNFFSLKMIKKQFPIHPSFQNKCLKSNSKIFKSHQIQPSYKYICKPVIIWWQSYGPYKVYSKYVWRKSKACITFIVFNSLKDR